jgi:enoyl-CoA hydratase/carnithine racemase
MARLEDYETIAVEIADAVAVLQLNRPEHRNSVDDRMHSELTTIFTDVRKAKDVRAVVLTGAGEAFCSGGDSSPTRRFETFTGLTPVEEARAIVETLIDLDQPLVAAVNGDALGLGAILATFADAAIVARSARIGDAHVRGGVTAGNGSVALWPLLVGLNKSKELLLEARLLDAEEALRIGLVRDVVDDVDVLPRAMALAREWAELPAAALQTTKRALNVHLKAAVAQVLPLALALEEQTLAPLMEARRQK